MIEKLICNLGDNSKAQFLNCKNSWADFTKGTGEVQNTTPQNKEAWHLRKQQSQKGLLLPSHLSTLEQVSRVSHPPLKEVLKTSFQKASPQTQKKGVSHSDARNNLDHQAWLSSPL